MSGYVRRVIDQELDELLGGLPAIALDGPRAVGKTSTAIQRAGTVHALDDPEQLRLAGGNPGRLVEGEPPVLIDEWQLLPQSWDLVRRAVDADHSPSRFLLTGSSSPANRPTHSGAGRIVSLRMRPMTLFERKLETPSVSVARLLVGKRDPIEGETSVTLDQYAHEVLASGFPAIRRQSERGIRASLDGYLQHVVDRDIEESGRQVRRPATLLRWLRAYASAESGTASMEKIRRAAVEAGSGPPAATTVANYQEALAALWLIDPIPGWKPTLNAMSRLTERQKHHLADPALTARLRGIGIDDLLGARPAGPLGPRGSTLLGVLFEALVVGSVRVYAQAAEGGVFHYRDRDGRREIDLIIEGLARRVLALEVKLKQSIDDTDVRHLRWLQQKLGPDLLDAGIITTGRYAYRREDGIAVIPAALLGP